MCRTECTECRCRRGEEGEERGEEGGTEPSWMIEDDVCERGEWRRRMRNRDPLPQGTVEEEEEMLFERWDQMNVVSFDKN